MTAIVDGAAGEVIFEPTGKECSEAEEKIRNEQEKARLLQELNKRKDFLFIHLHCLTWA